MCCCNLPTKSQCAHGRCCASLFGISSLGVKVLAPPPHPGAVWGILYNLSTITDTKSRTCSEATAGQGGLSGGLLGRPWIIKTNISAWSMHVREFIMRPTGEGGGGIRRPIGGPIRGQIGGLSEGLLGVAIRWPIGGPIRGPIGGHIGGHIRGPIGGPIRGPIRGPVRGQIGGPIRGPIGGGNSVAYWGAYWGAY